MSEEIKTAQTAEAPVKARLSTQKVVLILGGIIIICAAVLIAIFLLRSPEPEQTGWPALTAENVEQIQEELKEKVEKGMFMTYMNTIWNFPDGKSPSSNAIMGNSDANRYPFWFTVTLSDTDETVLTSGLLPVGSKMAEVKLERELAAGTYPAVLAINMVDEDGAPVDSNAGFNITLIIEK